MITMHNVIHQYCLEKVHPRMLHIYYCSCFLNLKTYFFIGALAHQVFLAWMHYLAQFNNILWRFIIEWLSSESTPTSVLPSATKTSPIATKWHFLSKLLQSVKQFILVRFNQTTQINYILAFISSTGDKHHIHNNNLASKWYIASSLVIFITLTCKSIC